MTPNQHLPSPTTTKPRSAFARLRAVTSSPHPPPTSAAAWTALLDEALLEAYGDADGARLAVAVLSTLPGEKPCESLAIVQCRAVSCNAWRKNNGSKSFFCILGIINLNIL